MEHLNAYAYDMWGSVLFNIFMFSLFAYFVFKPTNKKDWKTLGAFTAFLVALFTEMYGFPLTIYLLTSILGSKYPVADPLSHINGHLWVTLFGGSYKVYSILHPISNILIFFGLVIIAIGWKGIHKGNGELVTSGIYSKVRHPQYSGFTLTIIGFLLQWPTFITLIMAPILLIIYRRLAKKEEKVMIDNFGKEYIEYKKMVPAFIPIKLNKSKL